MKTFARLIRRYVLLAVGISLLLVVLAFVGFIWVGVRFGMRWQDEFSYSYSEIADHLQQDANGNFVFDTQDADRWMTGYAWAMVLGDDGQVLWEYRLPPELNHTYTASEIASFSRWYLADYPVFCQGGTMAFWYWAHHLGLPGGTIFGPMRILSRPSATAAAQSRSGYWC